MKHGAREIIVAMAGTGEGENSLSFTSSEEELEYWKEKAMEYRAKWVI